MASGQHAQGGVRTARRREGPGSPQWLREAEGSRARPNRAEQCRAPPPTEPSSRQVGGSCGDAISARHVAPRSAGAVLSPQARATAS